MAFKWTDNMEYEGAKNNFERDYFEVLHNVLDPETGTIIKKGMLDVAKRKMPNMFIAMCLETCKIYLYRKTNADGTARSDADADPVLGFWSEVGSAEPGSILKFNTIAVMALYTPKSEAALAYCAEDEKTYLYLASNTADPTTGKWRVFVTGSVNKEMVRCIAVEVIDPLNPPTSGYNDGNHLYDCTNDIVYLYSATWVEDTPGTGHYEYSVTDVTDNVTMFECSITESLYENLDNEVKMRDVTWYVD